MRCSLYVAFALALVAGNTQARADIVTYNMTGTVTSHSLFSGTHPSFAVGDHISWTLQYDDSAPVNTNSRGLSVSYQPHTLITNVVDHTSGTSFNTFSTSGALNYSSGSSSSFIVGEGPGVLSPTTSYYSTLVLNINGPLPTLNLANLQLNKLPLNLSTSNFVYGINNMGSVDTILRASVDSISAPMHGLPEPGSLTLFLLGAAGLGARGIRRHLGQVG